MICSWCRREYDGSPLYHVCLDGTTFDLRNAKTQDQIDEEHRRQDRVRAAYLNHGVKANYHDDIPMRGWDPNYDPEFLDSLRIKDWR